MIRNRRVEYSIIRSSARWFARITHSIACYALVALLPRSLRCAHSLAALRSFARLFCFCIHRDFTRTYTIYTICMKKKISFQFSFFFFFLAFACLEKIDNVESVFKVKYMERFFFLLLFNGKGKPRYMRFLEMNMMSRIDVSIWIKNLKKKIQCQFGFDKRLIQWLKIDTMTRNWYNNS